MNEIILEYKRSDIEKAFDLHYNKQFPVRSKLLLVLGFILIVASFVLLVSNFAYASNLKWIFALLGAFYIGFYFYRKKTMVNLAMKNPTISNMKKAELTENEIVFIGSNGYSKQEWGFFKQMFIDEFSLLLYLDKHFFFIIPISALSQEQLSFIQSKIKHD